MSDGGVVLPIRVDLSQIPPEFQGTIAKIKALAQEALIDINSKTITADEAIPVVGSLARAGGVALPGATLAEQEAALKAWTTQIVNDTVAMGNILPGLQAQVKQQEALQESMIEYAAAVSEAAIATNETKTQLAELQAEDAALLKSEIDLTTALNARKTSLLELQTTDDDLISSNVKLATAQAASSAATTQKLAADEAYSQVVRDATIKQALANAEKAREVAEDIALQDAIAENTVAQTQAAAAQKLVTDAALRQAGLLAEEAPVTAAAAPGGAGLLGIGAGGALTGSIAQAAALVGITVGVKDVLQSSQQLQVSFAQLKVLLDSIGQGGALPGLKASVDSIAASTGVSATSIASNLGRLVSAYQDSNKAIEAASQAAQISKTTQQNYGQTIQELIPIQSAYGGSFNDLAGDALKVQDAFTVPAAKVLQFFSAAAPLANQYGLSLKSLGALGGAALKDINTSAQGVAEDFNRTLLPNLSKALAGIEDQLKQSSAGRAILPTIRSDVSAGKEGDALNTLIQTYGQLNKAQQDALGQAIGGVRGTKDFAAALEDQVQIQKYLADSTNGAAREEKAWQAQTTTLNQQLSELGQSVLSLARDAFNPLIAALTTFATNLNDILPILHEATQILDSGSGGKKSSGGGIVDIVKAGVTFATAGLAAPLLYGGGVGGNGGGTFGGVTSDILKAGATFATVGLAAPLVYQLPGSKGGKPTGPSEDDLVALAKSATTRIASDSQTITDAIAAYNSGNLTIGQTLAVARQKLADLIASTGPGSNEVLAQQGAVNKIFSESILKSQDLANSLGGNSVSDIQGRVSQEVATIPLLGDPASRLQEAKNIVTNLKAELQAEADVAKTTADKNAILRDGLTIPSVAKDALAGDIVETDTVLQDFLAQFSEFSDGLSTDLQAEITHLVAAGQSVGDAAVQAARNLLDAASKLPLSQGIPKQIDDILALAEAEALRAQLNTVSGVPDKVSGPASDVAKTATPQELQVALDNLQAARDSADPVKGAQDAQHLADDQLALAQSTNDQVGEINAQAAQVKAQQQLALAQQAANLSALELSKAQFTASGDVIDAAKEQVAIIKQQIDNAIANKDGIAELNKLYADLAGAQANVTSTQISFSENQIQDNLDLRRETVAQAVAELRSLEQLATSQTQRDEIEKRVQALLHTDTQGLQYNLPTDINLPTLYEARRLNQTPAGVGYADNRNISIVLNAYNNTDVSSATSQIISAVNSRSYSTTGSIY